MLARAWLCCAAALGAWAAPPPVDVFRAGEGGYHTFRIPALAAAPDGTLLAFAEARKQNSGDPGRGDIDLVAKRSSDGGATWSALRVIDDPGENWSASNPTPVTDRDTGRVWLVYNRWEPGRGTESSRPGTNDNQTWTRFTTDAGLTWSEPRDLTRVARDFDRWGAMFTGPGGAVQTRAGRLVIPAATKAETSGRPLVMYAYALYSDDHGKTWQRGSLVTSHTDENQIVELPGGDLLMDARQGAGPHRWLVRSRDGGKTWSEPQPGVAVTPVCTSLVALDKGRLLWVGPAGPGRRRLVARVSRDEGRTWGGETLLDEGPAAYSSTVVLRDGSVLVLWERDEYRAIRLSRLERP